MNKETALKLFKEFESKQYAYEDTDAPVKDWKDANTPPIVEYPIYEVRLDASIDINENRDWRLRLLFTPGTEVQGRAFYLKSVMEAAGEHECQVAVQNNGIELS